jgi:hypothetical protein
LENKFKYRKWHWLISIVLMAIGMCLYFASLEDNQIAILLTVLFSFMTGIYWAVSFVMIHIMLYLFKNGKYPLVPFLFPTVILVVASLLIPGNGSELGLVLSAISTLVNTFFWFLSFHWKNKQA